MENQPTPVSSGLGAITLGHSHAKEQPTAEGERFGFFFFFSCSKAILKIMSRRGSQTLQGTNFTLPLTPTLQFRNGFLDDEIREKSRTY